MKKEIYFFSNAGGTIELFNGLCNELEQQFDCFPFEYPGHSSDRNGFCDSIEKLSKAAYIFFTKRHKLGAEFVLMGYSMGTIVAMELNKLIKDNNKTTPIGIVLAADPPRNMIIEENGKLEEENIKAFYMKNGGISEKLINSKLFIHMYLPSFRNDYLILKRYDYSKMNRNNTMKSVILYCEQDTPYEIMSEWASFFISKPLFIQYSGGHFFLRDHYQEIAQIIIKTFLSEK